MLHPITIALQTDKKIKDYFRLGSDIEKLGFDGVSVYNDLYFQPPWIPLTQLIQSTRSIRIGVASVNPFLTHPINIVGNLALLDEMSNGRMYLGLSRGSWLESLDITPKKPISALRDAFKCINYLLEQKNDSFESEFFPIKGKDTLRWKLHRTKIPMLLGSWGSKTIKRCKEFISEIKIGGTANPDLIPSYRKLLDTDKIGIVTGCVTVIDEDGDKVITISTGENKNRQLEWEITALIQPPGNKIKSLYGVRW